MISEKDYNEIYLKGYEDGKNDNDNLKISYEIKPSFTTRKIKELQQERDLYKEVIDKAIENIENFLCTEEYININGIAIADNYKELLEILKGSGINERRR